MKRILHIGGGFRPWRPGGLIAYVEDVARTQAAHGHEVTYFFGGRHLPGRRDPHLRRWSRDGVAMVELFNSPVMMSPWGTLRPGTTLAQPAAEAAFAAVLRRARPDVVHVHELSSLPSSLLTLARANGVPVVLTLHDFQLLCPTAWLFDADGQRCYRTRPGAMCAECCRAAPSDHAYLIRRTVEHLFLPSARGAAAAQTIVDSVRELPAMRKTIGALRRSRRAGDGAAAPPAGPAPASEYDRRRDANLQRLSEVDLLLPVSHRQAEICRALGVHPRRMQVLHTTVRHLAAIRPLGSQAPRTPMVFVTLNGCVSPAKGAGVVLDAIRRLDLQGLTDEYRLEVWGQVSPAARAALASHPSVRLRGTYASGELTGLLADADVGIMPSVVEEAYGYTGVEMLAAGVPIIGNALGGIVDYVIPGETGWLNESATGAELGERMRRLIEAPHEVEAVRGALRRRRPAAVKTIEAHVAELSTLYEEVISQCRETLPTPASSR